MSASYNSTVDPFAPFDLIDIKLDSTFGAVLLTTFFGLMYVHSLVSYELILNYLGVL